MLSKLKKLMKREKGFTLVELLAVIVILGIILAIAVPSITGLIDNSEADANEANQELFENAARLASLSEGTPDASYTLADLVSKGFLEEIPNMPGTDTPYSGTISQGTDGNYVFNSSVTTPSD